jgi:hypothetical protein
VNPTEAAVGGAKDVTGALGALEALEDCFFGALAVVESSVSGRAEECAEALRAVGAVREPETRISRGVLGLGCGWIEKK